VHGSLGYTIGTTSFTTPRGGFRSSYVAIWAKQPDGTWKVRFQTERSTNL
jgi:ketosteroid isomerase-like protein